MEAPETPAEKPHRMSVTEFHALGLIQEVNRRLLHPMGIALSVGAQLHDPDDPHGGFTVTGWGPIIDYRDSPEGMSFSPEELAQARTAEHVARVGAMLQAKAFARAERYGFFIQPAGIEPETLVGQVIKLALAVDQWALTLPRRPGTVGGGRRLVSIHHRPLMAALCTLGWWRESGPGIFRPCPDSRDAALSAPDQSSGGAG